MLDSGYECSEELVHVGGEYASKSWVDQGIATVEITGRFATSKWGQTHEYDANGLLWTKEKASHE
jgi:hypothetical protein